jgi:hypothetical protein
MSKTGSADVLSYLISFMAAGSMGASRGEDVSILSEHPHSHGVHEFLLYPLAGVEAFKLLVYDPMALLCGLLRVPGGRGLAGTGFLGPRPRE